MNRPIGQDTRSAPGREAAGEVGALRTLRVLTYLSKRATPVSAGTIARDCDIPRSSLYRILRVMQRMYFVVHLPEEELWGIGIGAFEIGSGYLRSGVLERSARPLLMRLTRRSGMVSHLGVLHGSDVLYLLKQTTDEPARPFVTAVGVRLPAHLTAMGRAMLAQLSPQQVRATLWRPGELVTRTGRGPRRMSDLRELLRTDRSRGYSVESSSTTEEVSCVAAAVFDHEGLPIAAVGVSYYDDLPSAEIERIASAVREAADGLTTRLSGSPVRRHA